MRNARQFLVLTLSVLLAATAVAPVAASPGNGGRIAKPVLQTHGGPHDTFQVGDVFVGANSGKVEWRLPDGTLNRILDTGASTSETTGMAFDFDGNLYVTAFQANQVYKFDNAGNLLGTFGSGYNAHPESIAFAADGTAYIGQADGNKDVLAFRPDGSLIASHDVATDRRGSDWIDLASDQCTLRYTSEGSRIFEYDVCSGTQLPDWGTLPVLPKIAFALRMIGDDTTIVADWHDIRWLDSLGGNIRTFDAPNEDNWFSLNLDPDGQSFWSANYNTGKVYKFDLATGGVLRTVQSLSGRVSGLAVYGEFRAGAVQSCEAEDLSGAFGQIDPVPANDERVTVKFDGRLLAEQDAAAVALAMAQKVKDRTEKTLREYRDDLDLPIPETIELQIKCSAGIGPFQADGHVPARGRIDLKMDFVRNELAAAAVAGFPPNDPNLPWDRPAAPWKGVIDHEIFHTIQFVITDLVVEGANGNWGQIESPPMVGQDLIADADDAGAENGSYLQKANDFARLQPRPSLQGGLLPDDNSYRIASVLQYFGERFGPQNEADLEKRVARWLAAFMAAPTGTQADDMAATIGYDWATNAYGEADLVAALRDYYLSHYALRASNVSAAGNPAFAILDAETGHGRPAGQAAPGQVPYDPFNVANRQRALVAGQNRFDLPLNQNLTGDVYELTFPAGTTHINFHFDASAFASFATALVAIQPNETFVLDPDLMFRGPGSFQPVDKRVNVIGAERVAVVFVRDKGPIFGSNLEVTATPVDGQVALQQLAPLVNRLRTPFAGPIVLNVRLTVDGQAITGDLPRSEFEVRVAGQVARIASVDFRGDQYRIEAWAPGSLANGSYALTLDVAGDSFGVGNLQIGPTQPRRPQQVASGSLGLVAQGGQAETTAMISAGASAADFGIDWTGSTFDLTLVSPTGRVILSTATDPDVTVTRTATSVTIRVASPEAGTWDVRAMGVDVPSPEEVTFAVAEDDVPVAGTLTVDGPGIAGGPLDVHFALSDQDGIPTDAAVTATIVDPSGTVRQVTLRDDGGSDAAAGDGVFGATVWATTEVGAYEVSVDARATVAGAPVQLAGSATVTLVAGADTDGDGVVDVAEVRLGLDPQDPADGASDPDGDGLTVAQELGAGSDPGSWDGDSGGEADRSELSAGREPMDAGDDAAVEIPILTAVPIDGSRVRINTRTQDGAGSVHVFRQTVSGSVVALGTFSGSGATFDDGPLAAGDYGYYATTVTAAGAESAPFAIGPFHVAGDVTRPTARITVNQGNWESTTQDVPVTFTDLSEAVTDMRLALSPVALEAAAWQPFTPFTSITLAATTGQQFVYAQVRDAAGNQSPVASSFVFLVDVQAPVGPTNLVAVAQRYDTIALSWTPPAEFGPAIRYTILRDDDAIAQVDGLATTFTDRSLEPSTTYSYRVTATNEAGVTTQPSGPAQATTPAFTTVPDTTPPTLPGGVGTVSPVASDHMRVTWPAGTDNVGITSYTIWRINVAVGVVAAIGPGPYVFNDRTVEPAEIYTYSITAHDAAGNSSQLAWVSPALTGTPACNSFCTSVTVRPQSDVSGAGFTPSSGTQRWAMLDEATPDGDTTYLRGPTQGTANAVVGVTSTPHRIYGVSWRFTARKVTTSGGTTTMNVRVGIMDGSATIISGQTIPLTTTYATYSASSSGITLAPGASLRLKIEQLSSGSNKVTSRFTQAEATVTYRIPDSQPPTAPSGVTATGLSPSAVEIRWTSPAVDNQVVAGYRYYRNGVQITSLLVGGHWIDTGLTADTEYTYTVAAIDAMGNVGAVSSPATVRTPSAPIDFVPPTTPTWGTATAVAATRVNLSWNASTDNVGVQGYIVYRNGVSVTNLPIGSTTFSDTGLTPGSTYSYAIEAIDGHGNVSARSTTMTATTPL